MICNVNNPSSVLQGKISKTQKSQKDRCQIFSSYTFNLLVFSKLNIWRFSENTVYNVNTYTNPYKIDVDMNEDLFNNKVERQWSIHLYSLNLVRMGIRVLQGALT